MHKCVCLWGVGGGWVCICWSVCGGVVGCAYAGHWALDRGRKRQHTDSSESVVKGTMWGAVKIFVSLCSAVAVCICVVSVAVCVCVVSVAVCVVWYR